MRISRPRRRGPLIGQRFVVPQNSQTNPNQWPENLRSHDLPTWSLEFKVILNFCQTGLFIQNRSKVIQNRFKNEVKSFKIEVNQYYCCKS